MSKDREERVRQRAHEIWLREGRPEGHGPRHWIEAEGEIDAEDAAAAPAKKAKATAKPKAAAQPKAAPKAKGEVKPAKKPAK